MMILSCSFSALMSGNSPLSVLQSHLLPRYLESSALSYLKGAVWSWDLDRVISHEGMICLSCSGHGTADLTAFELKSGRSLSDLGFCGLVRCLVRFHVILYLPCHLQVIYRTTIGNDDVCRTIGVGSIKLKNHVRLTRVLIDAWYEPKLKRNLISLGA